MKLFFQHSTRVLRWTIVLAALFWMLCIPEPSLAQLPDIPEGRCAGKLYYIAYPDTTSNRLDPRFPNNRVASEVSIWLFSTVKNKAIISGVGVATEVIPLEAGKFKVHTFKANPQVTAINTVLNKGIKIEADFPVALYCYMANFQSAEAWTPIPVENWGTKYYASCIPGEVVNEIGVADEVKIPHTPHPAPAEILVVAAYDNTTVSIIPPPGLSFVGNPPTVVMLDEGEVFQVQSRVDESPDAEQQDDIGASVIQSDKPVGVLSGNTRARVIFDDYGLKNNAYMNLLIEWLPPVDQHGTRFAWFPTWDQRRLGNPAPSRSREFARMYNTSGKPNMQGKRLQPAGTTEHPFTIQKRDAFGEFSFGQAAASYFETKEPSMLMMHSVAISRQTLSTPTGWGVPAQEFEGWAAYMAEMVPREQWTSFAPFYAPSNPSGMLHYISVVTDTVTARSLVREDGGPFPFTRKIPGTDLIWGTTGVTPAEDHWLYAKDGGTFTGVVFGTLRGEEKYRPGGAKKKDGKRAIAGRGGSGAPSILHPCEYEEYSALSYGYPLAPARCVLRQADTLQIDTLPDCTTLTIRIRAINADPVGLRSVTLDPATVENARLVPVNPARFSDIIGMSRVEVRVEPISPLRNASATVIIRDRTGKVWKVYYRYEAEYVVMTPATELNFGQLTVGVPVTKTVTITNPLARPIKVKGLRLANGNQGYTIVRSTPPVPTELAPNAAMTVEISSAPPMDNQQYVDSLKVILGCVDVTLPLITETARPLIFVNDVPFGMFVLGQDPPRTKPMRIQNIGTGEIRFTRENESDPDPNKLITWPNTNFYVAPADIRALEGITLKPNEQLDVNVTFDPNIAGLGPHRTVARVYANTRDVRDSSVWTALVVQPGPTIEGYDWKDRWVVNSLNDCTKNPEGSYSGTVALNNVGSSDDEVESLTLEGDDAQYFAFDNSNRLTTVLPGDLLLANSARPLTQAVFFRPKDERPYGCDVVLKTKGGSVISARLLGRGIESHGVISGYKFGVTKFTGPSTGSGGTAPIPGTVTLVAKPTRTLRIEDIQILDNPAEFYIDRAQFTGANAFPWILQPNDRRTINVEFRPQAPGYRTARIAFIGDHSFCDDSTNTLDGYSFTADVETRGHDFGAWLTCEQPEHMVVITNAGSEPLELRGVRLNNPDNAFDLLTQGINFPVTLLPNQPFTIPVRFKPAADRGYSGSVSFDVVNPRDSTVVPAPDAELAGAGLTVTVPAAIARNYHGLPGTDLVTPMMLGGSLDGVKIEKMRITLRYDRRAVKLMNGTANPADITSMTDNTLLKGWTLTVLTADPRNGVYSVEATAPLGTYLTGTGELLRPQFRLFLGRVDSSELPFTIELPDKPCAQVVTEPGLIRIDPVCGVNLRLIEASGMTYNLDQNKPNPFNPSTDITFSLGLDGHTRLTIYDAAGKLVATLIDAYMQPGAYSVTWDATAYPSGLYYYRLESGMWARTSTMLLRK